MFIVLIGACTILLIFLSNLKFNVDYDALHTKKDAVREAAPLPTEPLAPSAVAKRLPPSAVAPTVIQKAEAHPLNHSSSKEDEMRYIHTPPIELDVAKKNLLSCEQIHEFINIELNKLHGGLLEKTRGGLTTCTSKLNEKLDIYRDVYQKIYGREMTQGEFEEFKHKIEMS